MIEGHYRMTIRLELVTPSDPDGKGYVRWDTSTISDLTLTAGSEQNVLGQASQHVDVLLNTYTPVKGLD